MQLPRLRFLNSQLTDWELFERHCLTNGAMSLDALGDLWPDATWAVRVFLVQGLCVWGVGLRFRFGVRARTLAWKLFLGVGNPGCHMAGYWVDVWNMERGVTKVSSRF